jgi:hypothetical protein
MRYDAATLVSQRPLSTNVLINGKMTGIIESSYKGITSKGISPPL